jgi:hypothetical protein
LDNTIVCLFLKYKTKDNMKKSLLVILLAVIQLASTSQTVTTLRSDGVMLKNGQPFSPLGITLNLLTP